VIRDHCERPGPRNEMAPGGQSDSGCERELRDAHRLFTEMGATARAEQVARELA